MQGSFRRSEISSIDHVEVVDPVNRAHRAEEPVRCVSGAAHGSFRHDPSAQGDRGGRQGFRTASRVQPGRSSSSSVSRRIMSRWNGSPTTGMPRTSISTRSSIRSWSIHSVRLANLQGRHCRSLGIPGGDRRAAVKAGPEAAAGRLRCAWLFRYHQQSRPMGRGRTILRPECVWCVRRLMLAIDRAALVNVVFNGHVRADCAGCAAELAVFRRGTEGADARCREGKGIAAAGWCDACRSSST